ncbi:Zinc-type alcohol dehydrogenase-like protein [Fusarium oxysporum f. sp. albedinis]|nr:Zinc-type alcohol dehydrogenase-like protein [Fusarium oxysporum f. sp. albedinis]
MLATSTVKSIAGAVKSVGHITISITSPSQHFTKAEHRNFYSMQPKPLTYFSCKEPAPKTVSLTCKATFKQV